MNRRPIQVAILQNAAGHDPTRNLAWLDQQIATGPGCDLVALPEVFAFRGGTAEYREQGTAIPGPLTDRLSQWARQSNAWLLAGSILEEADSGVYNTSLLLDRQGEIQACYRKMHLFEYYPDNAPSVVERDMFLAGDQPVIADLEGWTCGLSICYDIRFPELYRHYAKEGCDILFIPANFTQRTGKDHWETLVRARAIENQAFVVAPNQCGTNPVSQVASYGHSMIVGPWGRKLAEASDAPGIIQATLDPALLEQTRQRVPALQHRRLV